MAGKKLTRDLCLSKNLFLRRQQLLASQQLTSRWPRPQFVPPNAHLFRRELSVFNEFSKKIKGEVDRNHEFQKSIKEIKEKAEELKGVKEDLKTTWQTLPMGALMVKWRNAERSRLLSSCTSAWMVFAQRPNQRQKRFLLMWKKRLQPLKRRSKKVLVLESRSPKEAMGIQLVTAQITKTEASLHLVKKRNRGSSSNLNLVITLKHYLARSRMAFFPSLQGFC